jgi:hypothetical protein
VLAFSWTGTWAIFFYALTLFVLFGTSFDYLGRGWRWSRTKLSKRTATAFGQPSPPTEGASASRAVDVRLLDVTATGGATDFVDFRVQVVNYGTRQTRCTVSAFVGGEEVRCHPATLDLLANEPPSQVRVMVERPRLGDLVPEFNHETTLYNETLCVTATAEGAQTSAEWHEVVYTADENSERHSIQQRKWRLGRGGQDPHHLRMEYLSERKQRVADRADGGDDDPYLEL